jgi:hypothetical protein
MPEAQEPNTTGASKDTASSGRHTSVRRQEFRQYPRFKLEDARATLCLKGFLTSIGLGKNLALGAVNLSEGGVLLLASRSLEAGTTVEVQVVLEKHGDTVQSQGEVRWCFQNARNAKEYYVGIMFTNLPDIEKKKIAKMREWFTSAEYKSRTITRRRKTQ